jgi:hypothetical protein
MTPEELTAFQGALSILSSLGFIPPKFAPYVKDLATDGPLVFALYTKIKTVVAATQGEAPINRDFDIVSACLPELKALTVALYSQIESPATGTTHVAPVEAVKPA